MTSQYSKDFLLELYKTMYTIRRFEELGIKLYRQGHIRGYFHPYWGEEAIAAGVCAALDTKDYIVSTHRGRGHCIAWGAVRRGGIASDIASIIQEDAFDYLSATVGIITGKNTPIPFNMELEKLVVPGSREINEASKKIIYN